MLFVWKRLLYNIYMYWFFLLIIQNILNHLNYEEFIYIRLSDYTVDSVLIRRKCPRVLWTIHRFLPLKTTLYCKPNFWFFWPFRSRHCFLNYIPTSVKIFPALPKMKKRPLLNFFVHNYESITIHRFRCKNINASVNLFSECRADGIRWMENKLSEKKIILTAG